MTNKGPLFNSGSLSVNPWEKVLMLIFRFVTDTADARHMYMYFHGVLILVILPYDLFCFILWSELNIRSLST